MHHAIALSDFFVIFVKIVQHFRRFGHFCWSLELGSCLMNNIMLMLREYYYTQQFFVIFIKIVLFVAFVIFVRVFKPWYALCQALSNFVFYILSKLLPPFSFVPLDPLMPHAITLNKFFVILSVLLTTCDYL